jgi:hypothetical protein
VKTHVKRALAKTGTRDRIQTAILTHEPRLILPNSIRSVPRVKFAYDVNHLDAVTFVTVS